MSRESPGLFKAKIESVKEFILQHPSAKDFEVLEAKKCSRRTIAYARAELVAAGLIPAPRRAHVKKAPSPVPAESPTPTDPSPPAGGADYSNQIVTPETLGMLAAPETPIDDFESDPETQKRMLREAKRMAFDIKLHADTRMSAMQLWVKLKDLASARDRGPGVPLTKSSALARLMELHKACGIELVIESIETLWGNKKEAPNASASVEASTPVGTPSAPGSAGHEGDPAQAPSLRTEHLDGGHDSTGQASDQGDHDLPGSPA